MSRMTANDKWRGTRVPLALRGEDVMGEFQTMLSGAADMDELRELLRERGPEFGVEVDEFGIVTGARGRMPERAARSPQADALWEATWASYWRNRTTAASRLEHRGETMRYLPGVGEQWG